MRRPLVIILTATLVVGASALPLAAAEGSNTPDPAAEQDFLALINSERSSRGLRALSWHTEAASVARAHSHDMANEGELHHNDRLGSQMSNWAALGENVGVGPSVSAIHGAFMGSSAHRSNILGNFTHVGLGVVERSGSLWVTEVFVTPQAPSGSGGSTDDGAKRKKAGKTSTRSSSPLTRVQRESDPRPTAPVRTASAAPIHRVEPPQDPMVGERTVAALLRLTDGDVLAPANMCRRWC